MNKGIGKVAGKIGPRSIGTVIGVGIATILGLIFWRKKRLSF